MIATVLPAALASDFFPLKRQAMAAHASQIAETSFLLAMPPVIFALVWGKDPGAPDSLMQPCLGEPSSLV
jgi:hypothetical protein